MSVVVVGSVNMDVVARVASIPRPGETVLARDSARGGGGKGANQAVAAARAGGARVAFVGAVGDDGDGAVLRAALAGERIDVSGLGTVTSSTGTALVSVADDGENAIVVIPGANHAIVDLSADQRRLVESADVVVAQLEIPVSAVLAAAAARRRGAVFVLNAAPSAPLADPALAARVLAAIDVLAVNEHELLDIAAAVAPARAADGLPPAVERATVDAAVEALAGRVPALVVTLGAAGALVVVGGERRTVPAFPAEAVDTTGAGDTFCGVLAARLSAGPSVRAGQAVALDVLSAAARAGAAAAALAVGRVGAQAAVPTAAEVDRLLREAS